MLEFRKVELSDKERITSLLHSAPDRGCEYTFGNIFIWRDVYGTKVAFTDDGLCVIRFEREVDAFLFPFGEGDVKKAVSDMMADAELRGIHFRIIAATTEDTRVLDGLFPDMFKHHTSRDFAEYVYNTEDLIELKGKKFHGKRNHIFRFIQDYPEYGFIEITPENIGEVREMNDRWYEEMLEEYGDDGLIAERVAANSAFDNFFELGFKGGYIKISSGIIGFSMGEPINSETFCVHIEKACYNINGAYTIINRDFAKCFCEKYRYINREDDVGDEGLRRAKLSYNPEILTDKYVVSKQ
ncbi:MAG: phosphatidylglycerol lysyltransferase domain-containing protein [Oscillospiraceae bacterium]